MLGLGLIIGRRRERIVLSVVARARAPALDGGRDRDGEHLIAACNADEDGQVLDEVLAIAPFLVLWRYLILNLSCLWAVKQ